MKAVLMLMSSGRLVEFEVPFALGRRLLRGECVTISTGIGSRPSVGVMGDMVRDLHGEMALSIHITNHMAADALEAGLQPNALPSVAAFAGGVIYGIKTWADTSAP